MTKRAAIITAFDPLTFKGGIETYTLQLLSLLKARNIDVTIYHTGLIEQDKALQSVQFHDRFMGNIYCLGKMLCDEQERFDFIIANSFYGMGYFPPRVKTFNIYHSSYSAYIAKYIANTVDDPYFPYMFLREEFGEYASGFNRINIAVSEEVKRELETIHGFTDIRVVPNGVDISLFKRIDRGKIRADLGIPADAFVGIFVGRWENIQKKSKIMERIISEATDLHWLLVLATGGDECRSEYKPNVIVRRDIAHEEMPMMYNAADFMLFPSAYEGFGMVIIEAMSCGLPVISTNVGVAATIYKNAPFNDILLPDVSETNMNDLAFISKKIAFLRDNPELSHRLGVAGHNLIREKYSLAHWEKNMEEVLGIAKP